MTVANMIIVPSSIQAVPAKGLSNKPLVMDNLGPLSSEFKLEQLRCYHAKLDLMHAMINPEQDDYDWQVENIHDWKREDDRVFHKVRWIGSDKQWLPLDGMRVHDPYVVVRYALKAKLTDNAGWE